MPFESMLTISAVLLIVSGGSKLADPTPTRGALHAAGLVSGGWVVVCLAVAEVAAGVVALTVPGRVVALPVAALYLGFAGFVAWALRSGIPLQSCGCFGRRDTPPGRTHLVVNLTAAAAALAAAHETALLDRVLAAPVTGLLELIFAGIGAFLTYLVLAVLPETLTAAKAP
jgi:hypothetical protein